jgi:hypothetical protein
MKKDQFTYLLIFTFTILFISSCIDNSDKPIGPATSNNKNDLLTASPWKLSAYTINPAVDVNNDGTPETDLYPIAAPDSCTKDDITVFKTDLTYTREEGATKCDTTAEQIFETGTWSFSGNNTKLIQTKSTSGTADTYDILELSETTLILSFKETNNGVDYTFTQTLKH